MKVYGKINNAPKIKDIIFSQLKENEFVPFEKNIGEASVMPDKIYGNKEKIKKFIDMLPDEINVMFVRDNKNSIYTLIIKE